MLEERGDLFAFHEVNVIIDVFVSDLDLTGRNESIARVALVAPRRGKGPPSRLEPSGRDQLPWALVKIHQLISKIKLKEDFRNKTNARADREAARVC